MKITNETHPNIVNNHILDLVVHHVQDEHRRGGTFYRQSIVEIKSEEDESLNGLWRTNSYIWDDNYGLGDSTISSLVKVEKVEKEVTYVEISYKEI